MRELGMANAANPEGAQRAGDRRRPKPRQQVAGHSQVVEQAIGAGGRDIAYAAVDARYPTAWAITMLLFISILSLPAQLSVTTSRDQTGSRSSEVVCSQPGCLAMKSRIRRAISSVFSSSAKWPASNRWISASGRSRLNASAPGAVKEGSFAPHATSVGGL